MNYVRLTWLGILTLSVLPVLSHYTGSYRKAIIGREFDTEKIVVINDLMDECSLKTAYEAPLSDSCVDRLADYFSDQPVWEQAVIYIPSLDRFHLLGPILNSRSYSLSFTQSEMMGDVPTWQDIFDNGVKERARVVEQVLQDEACGLLSSRGAINTDSDMDLLNKCKARDLVKYAIYLDACLTGMDRIDFLLVPRDDGTTWYEDTISVWNEKLSTEENKVALAKLGETVMHALWMRNACVHMPLDGFDGAFRSTGWNPEVEDVSTMAKPLQHKHDLAMSVSARSGDVWAIQAFYVKELRLDKEYWKSLYKIDPLLFHRWITVVGSANGLSEKEIVMHALKAYNLETLELDDLDFDEYISRHEIPPNSDTVLSLKENPIQDAQLLKPWVDLKTNK
ncbi:MAG: hypothetical protein F4W92_08720 [Gammaproteobacteria bacterium]|nr:hypothetical protein [Gammaproteobacteria bacterium]